jgi:hypothetical protein
VFTIAGVMAVNSMSGASTGSLRQFAVRDDEVSAASRTSTGSGDMTALPILPTISYVSSGPYNNIDHLPTDGDAMVFMGTESTAYPQNLVFHPNAFALVTVPIEMPANVWGARETDPDVGMSIRIVKTYDITTDLEVIRMDILYGVKTIYPELAVRLWG